MPLINSYKGAEPIYRYKVRSVITEFAPNYSYEFDLEFELLRFFAFVCFYKSL